jgi:hypothetical protein
VLTQPKENCDGRVDIALFQETLHKGFADLLL